MGPVELVYFAIGILVTLIGLARGYDKELGNSVIILVTIFVLTFLGDRITGVLNLVLNVMPGLSDLDEGMRSLLSSAFFEVFFIVVVFASYAGRTLTMGGSPAKPPLGTIYTVSIALLNGYLVAGTLWYYQDKYAYPLKVFGLVNLPLTQAATAMVEYLPQNLFPSPIYWMVPVALLLILRVRG